MNVNYLFPNKYKPIGWFVLIPSAIFLNLLLAVGVAAFDAATVACFVASSRVVANATSNMSLLLAILRHFDSAAAKAAALAAAWPAA